MSFSVVTFFKKCLKNNDNLFLKPYIMKNKNLEGDSSPREKRGSE